MIGIVLVSWVVVLDVLMFVIIVFGSFVGGLGVLITVVVVIIVLRLRFGFF